MTDIAPSRYRTLRANLPAGFHVPLRRNANQEILGFEAARRADAYDGEQCEAVAYDGSGLELWFTCKKTTRIRSRWPLVRWSEMTRPERQQRLSKQDAAAMHLSPAADMGRADLAFIGAHPPGTAES